MSIQKTIINRFRTTVDKNQLTRESLGKVLNCSASNASKKYSGDIKITFEDLDNLSNKLNISPAYLLGLSDEPDNDDEFIREICLYTGLEQKNIFSLNLAQSLCESSKSGLKFINEVMDSLVFDIGKNTLTIDKIIENKMNYLADNIDELKKIYMDLHFQHPENSEDALNIYTKFINDFEKVVAPIYKLDEQLNLNLFYIKQNFNRIVDEYYTYHYDVNGTIYGEIDKCYKSVCEDFKREKNRLLIEAKRNEVERDNEQKRI